MIDGEILRRLGPRLAHVTARSNLQEIRRAGLISAAQLAWRNGTQPATIAKRARRLQIGPAKLNHQRLLLAGGHKTQAMLDGHTLESWAAQLDRRIFFATEPFEAAFKASFGDEPAVTLWFDTEILVKALSDNVFTSPLNSGSFRHGGGGKPRGDWLYVPVTAGYATYRTDRTLRGIVKTADTRIKEVSFTSPITPRLMHEALLSVD